VRRQATWSQGFCRKQQAGNYTCTHAWCTGAVSSKGYSLSYPGHEAGRLQQLAGTPAVALRGEQQLAGTPAVALRGEQEAVCMLNRPWAGLVIHATSAPMYIPHAQERQATPQPCAISVTTQPVTPRARPGAATAHLLGMWLLGKSLLAHCAAHSRTAACTEAAAETAAGPGSTKLDGHSSASQSNGHRSNAYGVQQCAR
jgi:hypothetical protein